MSKLCTHLISCQQIIGSLVTPPSYPLVTVPCGVKLIKYLVVL